MVQVFPWIDTFPVEGKLFFFVVVVVVAHFHSIYFESMQHIYFFVFLIKRQHIFHGGWEINDLLNINAVMLQLYD